MRTVSERADHRSHQQRAVGVHHEAADLQSAYGNARRTGQALADDRQQRIRERRRRHGGALRRSRHG
jgi:hypothetical protein